MTSFDAVFVGVATLDAIAVVDGFPGPDDRVIADAVVYAGGGPAATSAVTAARLGASVAFVGTVGDDANGAEVIRGLRDEGIDTSGVAVTPTSATGASVVVVDTAQGTRAICNRPGPVLDLSRGEQLLRTASLVHVDHFGWQPLAATGWVADRGRISVDAGNPVPGFSPRGVGLYVPTVEALARTYGDGVAVADLLDRAIADGALTVVATSGAAGSWGRTSAGVDAFAPAHAVDVVSTLGAGDVYHGALVAAVLRGMTLDEQLAFANVVAGLSCRAVDGRSGIPDLREALQALPASAQ